MNERYVNLVAEWHDTLVDLVVASTGVDEWFRERAFRRMLGLSDFVNLYKRYGLAEEWKARPVLPRHDVSQAIRTSSTAFTRLSALYDASSWLDGDAPTERFQRQVHRNLAQRRRRLPELVTSAREMLTKAPRAQMNAIVPAEYACDVLRTPLERRPVAHPGEALAVIALYEGGVPASYAVAVLSQSAMNEKNALVVCRMYDEGIPAELGAALV